MDLSDTLAEIWKEIAAMKAAQARTFTEGPVAKVDAAKQLARIEVGKDEKGAPVLGPWVPYSQLAGGLKGHVPVTVGQQMTQIAPNGDWSRAALVPLTFSNANKSPSSKGDENVWTFGSAKVALRGNEITVEVPRLFVKCGATTFELTSAGLNAVTPHVDWQKG